MNTFPTSPADADQRAAASAPELGAPYGGNGIPAPQRADFPTLLLERLFKDGFLPAGAKVHIIGTETGRVPGSAPQQCATMGTCSAAAPDNPFDQSKEKVDRLRLHNEIVRRTRRSIGAESIGLALALLMDRTAKSMGLSVLPDAERPLPLDQVTNGQRELLEITASEFLQHATDVAAAEKQRSIDLREDCGELEEQRATLEKLLMDIAKELGPVVFFHEFSETKGDTVQTTPVLGNLPQAVQNLARNHMELRRDFEFMAQALADDVCHYTDGNVEPSQFIGAVVAHMRALKAQYLAQREAYNKVSNYAHEVEARQVALSEAHRDERDVLKREIAALREHIETVQKAMSGTVAGTPLGADIAAAVSKTDVTA